MRPVECAGLEVRRGALDHDIGMEGRHSLLRIAVERSVGKLQELIYRSLAIRRGRTAGYLLAAGTVRLGGIDINLGSLLLNDDVDLDTLFGLTFQQPVQTITILIRSTQVEFYSNA